MLTPEAARCRIAVLFCPVFIFLSDVSEQVTVKVAQVGIACGRVVESVENELVARGVVALVLLLEAELAEEEVPVLPSEIIEGASYSRMSLTLSPRSMSRQYGTVRNTRTDSRLPGRVDDRLARWPSTAAESGRS